MRTWYETKCLHSGARCIGECVLGEGNEVLAVTSISLRRVANCGKLDVRAACYHDEG